MVYLVAIGAAAAIGSVPPLLVRNLVDTITNHGGMGQVDLLAAAMVGWPWAPPPSRWSTAGWDR